VFQSLNRAYKRSDCSEVAASLRPQSGFNPSIGLTSVPTLKRRTFGFLDRGFNPSIGLTSVPTLQGWRSLPGLTSVSIPQSGLQAFRPTDDPEAGANVQVSIPQSGLQAFRHRIVLVIDSFVVMFQSLNRAYKRSDFERN